MTVSFNSIAQEIRLNVYSSYAFDDYVDSYYSNNSYYKGNLQGGLLWGGGIEYALNEDYGIELVYLRLDSEAPMTFATSNMNIKNKVFKYGLNYVLVGSNRYASLADGKLEPYCGLLIGMAVLDLKNPEPGGSSTITKLAWGVRGGMNYWITGRVGIFAQIKLVSAVQAVGGTGYFGSGGSGVALNTYSSMLQFNLGGGLTFKLKS